MQFYYVNLLCANEPVKSWRYHQRFKSEQALPSFIILFSQSTMLSLNYRLNNTVERSLVQPTKWRSWTFALPVTQITSAGPIELNRFTSESPLKVWTKVRNN